MQGSDLGGASCTNSHLPGLDWSKHAGIRGAVDGVVSSFPLGVLGLLVLVCSEWKSLSERELSVDRDRLADEAMSRAIRNGETFLSPAAILDAVPVG